jgi:hypothetical protein
VMLEVADERLEDVDSDPDTARDIVAGSRIRRDHAELLRLSLSLSQMARSEIDKLDAEPPNDSDAIAKHEKQREILQIFADGFDHIAEAIAAFASNPDEPLLLGRAIDFVDSVGNQVTKWWKQNGTDVVDWAIRLPILAGGIAALGWAGADMTVGTTAVAALVGGEKVFKAIRGKTKAK